MSINRLANLPMWLHANLTPSQIKRLITSGQIQLGGNAKLKIYGTLSCSSGKRMKEINRVFFESEEEAVSQGFRPCKKCVKLTYSKINKPIIE